jgi:F-type H+-transporting ATPase subunit epsilon
VPDRFHCTIVTPEKQVLDAEVTYASLPAWDGLLGLAPQRAPLMLKLGDGPMRLDFPEGGSRWFFLAGGFAQMKDNRLAVLTEEAIGSEEIVRQDVEAARKEAEARVARSDEEVAKRDRQINRARHLIDVLEHQS